MNLRHATIAGFGLLLAACSTPTAGPAAKEAGPGPNAAEEARVRAIWKETTVGAGLGEAHNLLPEETAMVKAAVDTKKSAFKKCFEEPVLRRGCRTAGLPSSFDAMLMIDTEGFVRDTRIVPNKNDLPKECYDGVSCVQDALGGVQVQGLTRFQGTRQIYMTVTLKTPDESTLGAADGG